MMPPAPVIPAPAAAPAAPATPPAKPAEPKIAAPPPATPPATPKAPDAGALKEPAAPPATPPVQATAEKPYVLKVNGKDVTMSLDEVLAAAQKAEAANQRFQEGHKMKVQAGQFMHLLQTNPMAIFDNPNMPWKFKELAQQYLLKEIEREGMTPEQRELEDTRAKLKAAEDEKRDGVERQAQEREAALVKHYNDAYEKDIISALADGSLPKTRGTVRRISYYLAEGLKRGVELKAADVVPLVREDYEREMKEILQATDGDNITKILGDPILQKIREAELKRLNGGGTPPPPAAPKTPATVHGGKKPTVKVSKDEWRKQMDEEFPEP